MLFPEGMIASCLAPSHVLALHVTSAELWSEDRSGSRSEITGRDPQAHFLLAVVNLWGPFWSLEPLDIEKLCVRVQWWDWREIFILIHSPPTFLSSGETSQLTVPKCLMNMTLTVAIGQGPGTRD